jgi:hypothetical protein
MVAEAVERSVVGTEEPRGMEREAGDGRKKLLEKVLVDDDRGKYEEFRKADVEEDSRPSSPLWLFREVLGVGIGGVGIAIVGIFWEFIVLGSNLYSLTLALYLSFYLFCLFYRYVPPLSPLRLTSLSELVSNELLKMLPPHRSQDRQLQETVKYMAHTFRVW